MSWLDKLLGRGKKVAGDMTGKGSMKPESTRQDAPSGGMPTSPGQPSQEEQQPPAGSP